MCVCVLNAYEDADLSWEKTDQAVLRVRSIDNKAIIYKMCTFVYIICKMKIYICLNWGMAN